MQEEMCAVCGEGAATDRTCQQWLQSFVPEICRRTMLHSRGDQLKWTAIESRH